MDILSIFVTAQQPLLDSSTTCISQVVRRGLDDLVCPEAALGSESDRDLPERVVDFLEPRVDPRRSSSSLYSSVIMAGFPFPCIPEETPLPCAEIGPCTRMFGGVIGRRAYDSPQEPVNYTTSQTARWSSRFLYPTTRVQQPVSQGRPKETR